MAEGAPLDNPFADLVPQGARPASPVAVQAPPVAANPFADLVPAGAPGAAPGAGARNPFMPLTALPQEPSSGPIKSNPQEPYEGAWTRVLRGTQGTLGERAMDYLRNVPGSVAEWWRELGETEKRSQAEIAAIPHAPYSTEWLREHMRLMGDPKSATHQHMSNMTMGVGGGGLGRAGVDVLRRGAPTPRVLDAPRGMPGQPEAPPPVEPATAAPRVGERPATAAPDAAGPFADLVPGAEGGPVVGAPAPGLGAIPREVPSAAATVPRPESFAPAAPRAAPVDEFAQAVRRAEPSHLEALDLSVTHPEGRAAIEAEMARRGQTPVGPVDLPGRNLSPAEVSNLHAGMRSINEVIANKSDAPAVVRRPDLGEVVIPRGEAGTAATAPDGFVRMFSTAGTEANGARWASPDLGYVRAHRPGEPISYVDVPIGHRSLIDASGASAAEHAQMGTRPTFTNSLLPREVAQQMRPFPESGAAPGTGLAHALERRAAAGETGPAAAGRIAETIALGKPSAPFGPGESRINITYRGHTAELTLERFGDQEGWRLTGWQEKPQPNSGAVPGARPAPVVEAGELVQRVPLPSGRSVTWRGPMDMVSYLRSIGGLREEAGELAYMGITNARRDVPFARNEWTLGSLVREKGLPHDEAAYRAWEAGYFPELRERPTVDEFRQALRDTYEARADGTRRFTEAEREWIDARRRAAERDIDREAHELGLDISEMTNAQAADAIDSIYAQLAGRRGNIGEAERWASAPRVGEPVTPQGRQFLDDFKTGPIPERAGNIRMDKLDSVEDIRRTLRTVADQNGGHDQARRGVVSHETTQALADDMGMAVEDLTARRHGQAFNAHEALAARQLLAESAEDLVRLARDARGGSDAVLLEFQKALTRHVAIQEQVARMTAEAGRALNSFKIVARSEAARVRAIKNLLDAGGGREHISEIAAKVSDFNSPEAVNSFARNAYKATTKDMLIEAWINGLLMGPKTHAVNMMSNALTQLWTIPEHALAAGFGKLHGGEKVFLSEVGSRLFGLAQGAKEGLRAAGKAFKTGEPGDLVGKIETARQKAIPGPLGEAVRIPSRFLLAEDEFFKAVAYRSELNSLAVRQAKREGLRGAAFRERVGELVNTPPDALAEQAHKFARYVTFQSPLGPTAQAVAMFSNSHPAAKVIVPFVRTPTNILKFAGERSPFGLLMKDVRANLSGANGNVARDIQRARLTLASITAVGLVSLAAEGLITGNGPSDPNLRAAKMATGWRPLSIKVGNEFHSYARLDPFAMTLGTIADAVDLAPRVSNTLEGKPRADEMDKLATMIVGSISKNLVSKTWLRGISDMVQAVSDVDRRGERWVQSLMGTVIPAGVAQVAAANDPVLRDARSVLDTWRVRSGFGSDVVPRRDWTGEPILKDDTVGPSIVSPFSTSRLRDDKAIAEVDRLQIGPKPIEHKLDGKELTPEQHDRLAMSAGRLAKATLDRLVTQPGYDQTPDFAKVALIREVIEKSRAVAKAQLYRDYPALVNQKVEQRVEKVLHPTKAIP